MIRSGIIALWMLQMPYPGMPPMPPLPSMSMPSDPRLRTIEYQPEQIVRLEVATGYQLSVEFAPDEKIETVAVGDSGAWLVTANQRGTHLFIKPTSGDADSNMTVITDTRVYLFDLHALEGPNPGMAYTVRFAFPAPKAAALVGDNETEEVEGEYRLSGDHRLYPSQMGDDGIHTYIIWPEEVALPAMYTVDERGEERLVNGAMRDGMYVIDAVAPKLTFRIDNRTAHARRIVPREER
ncbi:MAG: TrbG/VirB9 family P-type conjugative transfer protein [Blastomonas fulva]|uniref:TrbG/VirB9 family P-type conjugative transfer protein n=1 Tax=Blastomonas fulva TaxID=1550728 RepID=UPI0024E20EC2|nr:TrbG/VirB9 family P-type conjugative transfer protein [Blastomonas fulva]MDK2756128.1 TrbG/VirB9 family P-type conjugative transfer protein [Blastomonas fulva]